MAPVLGLRSRLAQAAALGFGFALTTVVPAPALPVHCGDSMASIRASAAGPVHSVAALVLGSAAAWIRLGIRRPSGIPSSKSGPRVPVTPLPSGRASGHSPPMPSCSRGSPVQRCGSWAQSRAAGWSATSSAILWMGHAVVAAFTLGHLGGLHIESFGARQRVLPRVDGTHRAPIQRLMIATSSVITTFAMSSEGPRQNVGNDAAISRSSERRMRFLFAKKHLPTP